MANLVAYYLRNNLLVIHIIKLILNVSAVSFLRGFTSKLIQVLKILMTIEHIIKK